jgi:hypothetical protein
MARECSTGLFAGIHQMCLKSTELNQDALPMPMSAASGDVAPIA